MNYEWAAFNPELTFRATTLVTLVLLSVIAIVSRSIYDNRY